MNDPASDILHRLDQRQYEKALEILVEEQTANRLTRMQLILYRSLMIAAYGSFVLMVVLIGCALLFPQWFSDIERPPILVALLIGFMLLIFSIPLLVLMNLSLLRKAWHQWWLIRKLNLRALYAMSWRAQKKKRRWRGILRAFIALFGMLFIVLAFIRLGEKQTWELLVYVSIGLTIFGVLFIRLWKEKMDTMMNVNNLKESLLKYREDAQEGKKNFIEVPYDKMAQIARIEESQIARQRAAAIDGMSEVGRSGYTSRRSKSFQESAASIGAEYRLTLEERIQGLLDDPRPGDAIPSSDRKSLVLNIPGTSYALTYAIDEPLRQIDLLAITTSIDDAHRATAP